MDVVALDLVAVLGDLHLGADEPDVADVMLRAGIRTAGEVDVDRAVELHARSRTNARSPRRDAWCWTLRACSRHCRCRRRGRRGSKSPWSKARSLRWRASAAATRSSATPEIRRFCQTVRRISPSPNSCGDLGEPAHLLGGDLADRKHDADPVKAFLLLRGARRYAPAGRRPAAARWLRPARAELAAELVFHRGEEFLKAPGVEHIFEPRLGAIGAVAVVDEDAHHGVGHHGRLVGLDDRRRCRGRSPDGR